MFRFVSLNTLCATLIAICAGTFSISPKLAVAEVSLPNVFSDHMVLQHGSAVRIWGRAAGGEQVEVRFGGQKKATKADGTGVWQVSLDALQPNAVGQSLEIIGTNTVKFDDVLVGEVWLCSGQSNMAWQVSNANDADLEIPTANYPLIRLISVPQVGTQEPQWNFSGKWERCSPETVGSFSAVGYFFGRQLHQQLNMPVGLIDNAWGGSACEAWIPRELLEKDSAYSPLLQRWSDIEENYDHDKALAAYAVKLRAWQERVAEARAAKKSPPNRPRPPRNQLVGQHRPANLYNGVLKPIVGYGMRGAIWYQGESNASRAYQYRDLFPLMIQSWRDEWGIGDFPFYWVQLADFRAEVSEPADSDWAELREAQTMTMAKLPNTGQAVIVDVGEGRDIHPRNKQTVAKRLARWALATQYGKQIVYRSPEIKSVSYDGQRVTLTFDHVGKSGLYAFDSSQMVLGFTVAGADKKFVKATAKIVGKDTVQVSSEIVKNPIAVRYAWADNPIVNLQSREGLPVTPFRSDDWPGITVDAK